MTSQNSDVLRLGHQEYAIVYPLLGSINFSRVIVKVHYNMMANTKRGWKIKDMDVRKLYLQNAN